MMLDCHILPGRLFAVFSWPALLAIVCGGWIDGVLVLALIPKRGNALVLIVVSLLLPAYLLASAYLADERLLARTQEPVVARIGFFCLFVLAFSKCSLWRSLCDGSTSEVYPPPRPVPRR